ncbi:MAG TPA: FEA1-related lipoprotein, partial [Euzebya sp.]|nr:FEA1-related lipoprotein [Euzebya sp.]
EEIDFDAVAAIYAEGGSSVNSDGSIRSLGGFATAEDRLHGLAEHYGTATPLDDFITSALEGTGPFEGAADAGRRQGVQKGIQNQVMVAWTVHELNAALEKAAAGEFDPAEGAPHNWDEAWAFYHGAEPGCSAYATGDKRAENFGTVGADGTTALANEAILTAMNAGRDALLAEDAEGAAAAAEEVERNLVIIYSQAAIRYASVVSDDVAAGDLESAATHQAEGLSFFRVIAPIVAQTGADVEAINAVFDLFGEPASAGGEDEVRAALQPAFDTLSIAAEDIGELQ